MSDEKTVMPNFNRTLSEHDGSGNLVSRIYMLDNAKHRTDGPAVVYANGDVEYWVNGVLHNEDGPAVQTATIKKWYVGGRLHRVGGPAIIATGTKDFNFKDDNLYYEVTSDKFEMWIENGEFHRIDGPAVIMDNGDMCWYLRGSRHNLTGPTKTVGDKKHYWINGSMYNSEVEYKIAAKRFIESRNKFIRDYTESIHGFVNSVDSTPAPTPEPVKTSGKFVVEIDGKVVHCDSLKVL